MTSAAKDGAFCCNCGEDFRFESNFPRMGHLTPLAAVPRRLRERFASWVQHDDGSYLCGNCYFDLTDG